ncbi:MAG: ATP-binding protein [Clostridiales bacterium]|nr:ATP-binding protein [Clostridiales bacterium]
MLKLIVGVKGTGKTKTIIALANKAVEESKGSVVFVEKGTKLIHEVNYRARLIDSEDFAVNSAEALYGFMAGIYASNHDVTHIFIDSALKICNNDIEQFTEFVKRTAMLGEANNINFIFTSSLPLEDVPEELGKYILPL